MDASPGRPGVRTMAIGLATLAFLLGGVFGAAVQSARLARAGTTTQLRLTWPSGLPPAFGELDLTAEQRAAVLAILARQRPRTEAIMREALPRLRAITDTVDAEIRAVLSPAQRERLERIRGVRGPVLLLKRGNGGGEAGVDTVGR